MGIAIFNVTYNIRIEFLDNMFRSIILMIRKYADLSAKYGCGFTLSLPRIPLVEYSISLGSGKYCIFIEGICVFEEEEEYYNFNKALLEAGGTYSIKAYGREVILK
jgi:hypothetical protein